MLEMAALYEARLAARAEERAALSSELGVAAAAGVPAVLLAAGAYSTDGVGEGQREVVEALNATVRRERALTTLYSMCFCALLSPAQFATVSTRVQCVSGPERGAERVSSAGK